MIPFRGFDERGEFIERLAAISIESWVGWKGARLLGTERLAWIVSEATHPLLNPILIARFALPADEDQFRRLLADYGRGKAGGSFLFTPFSTPRELPRLLAPTGFSSVAAPIGMAVVRDRLEAPHTPMEALALVEATTREQMTDWNRIFAAVFEIEPDLSAHWLDLHLAIGFGGSGPWRHYLALLDGERVGIASAFVHSDAVSLFNLGVLVAHRRRGIGSALAAHSLSASAGRETRCFTLTALEDAASLFEQLGFKRYWSAEYLLSEGVPSAAGDRRF